MLDYRPLVVTTNTKTQFAFSTDCSQDRDKHMRPCGDVHPTTCIAQPFFNDSIVNCPFIDCVDEAGCSKNDLQTTFDDVQPPYGSKILICSLSFVFITFGSFACLIWLCKKHKVLCWADQFAHPSRAQARVMEMNENPGVNAAPSAPPPLPLPEEDKPPSYESLFPSR